MDLSDCLLRVRHRLVGWHPRGRRWQRFLRTLPLDPEALPRPLAPPGEHDFLICGPPRSGTTLLAAQLFQPPAIVTVVEPWDGMRQPPAELFRSIRTRIGEEGAVSAGRLDVEELRRNGRVERRPDGSTPPVPVEADAEEISVGVKWPAFWRYLELLPNTRFLVCVRDPADLVSSFKRSSGRLALGLDYDTRFNRRMNEELRHSTADPATRRILLCEYVFSRIAPFASAENVKVVRYEKWSTQPESVLRGLAAFLGTGVGEGPARISPPSVKSPLSDRERKLVRELCPSASALGYAA